MTFDRIICDTRMMVKCTMKIEEISLTATNLSPSSEIFKINNCNDAIVRLGFAINLIALWLGKIAIISVFFISSSEVYRKSSACNIVFLQFRQLYRDHESFLFFLLSFGAIGRFDARNNLNSLINTSYCLRI